MRIFKEKISWADKCYIQAAYEKDVHAIYTFAQFPWPTLSLLNMLLT